MSLEATPFQYVETEQQLKELVTHLEDPNIKEIAVDLEAHAQRSYSGFTCLMQVSTRSRDFVVDTIKLRNEMPLLRPVFADGAKTKILHGSNSDIVWL